MPSLPLTPEDVPALNGPDGERLCYLDSAATSLKPKQVVDRVAHFYLRENAPVHRGVYELSSRATDLYENARSTVAAFVGADPEWLVFTRGTTETMNLIARAWGEERLGQGDELLVSAQEHHSNMLPWQELVRRTGASLIPMPLHADGTVDTDGALNRINPRTKLVAMAHVSNVLGIENPVQEIFSAAKSVGALTVLDGAQSVPTRPVDVHVLGCDVLGFSGHKMLGPSGIGALIASPELLEDMSPYQTGGGMIERAAIDSADYLRGYARFEAGTPNPAGAIGLAAACDYLDSLTWEDHEGMEAVAAYEMAWGRRAVEQVREIEGVRLIGPPEGYEPEGGIVALQMEGLHPHDLTILLDAQGVMVRAGHHCAMPLHEFLSEDGAFPETSLRASAYVYNTLEDADRLTEALRFARGALMKRRTISAQS
jgi:cysteine desulfurase / selenocysteine lyase